MNKRGKQKVKGVWRLCDWWLRALLRKPSGQVVRLVHYRIQGEAEDPSGNSLLPVPLWPQWNLGFLANDFTLNKVSFRKELHPFRRERRKQANWTNKNKRGLAGTADAAMP